MENIEFTINFTGCCFIDAESKEDAEEKFYNNLHFSSSVLKDSYFDIESMEWPMSKEEIKQYSIEMKEWEIKDEESRIYKDLESILDCNLS